MTFTATFFTKKSSSNWAALATVQVFKGEQPVRSYVCQNPVVCEKVIGNYGLAQYLSEKKGICAKQDWSLNKYDDYLSSSNENFKYLDRVEIKLIIVYSLILKFSNLKILWTRFQ